MVPRLFGKLPGKATPLWSNTVPLALCRPHVLSAIGNVQPICTFSMIYMISLVQYLAIHWYEYCVCVCFGFHIIWFLSYTLASSSIIVNQDSWCSQPLEATSWSRGTGCSWEYSQHLRDARAMLHETLGATSRHVGTFTNHPAVHSRHSWEN